MIDLHAPRYERQGACLRCGACCAGENCEHLLIGDDGSTFTLDVGQHPTGLPNNYTSGDDVFVTYIDKLATASSASFTAVYSAPKYMAVLVRDGGTTPKKEFLSPATFGASGFSITDTAIADV